MKLKIIAFGIFILLNIKAFSQFKNEDITITTKGLSEQYSSRFKESSNKSVLINMFNQLNITHEIAPIKVFISYENGEGNVLIEINYNHEKIFSGSNNYSVHNDNWSRYGKGISVYLQDQLFMALGQYKKSVATKGYLMDKDLLKFESSVKLKKINGDWVSFYAYNYFDSQGFYPFTFYKNVQINVGSKAYKTETSNTKMLNDMKFFMVSKTIDLDGSKTGAYYFCKFFNIDTN